MGSFVKGFLATLAFILAQIVVVISGILLGSYLFMETGSLLWFFVPFFVSVIISWAIYGGFMFGAAKKVVGE